ncbi:hypothetical protein Q4Q35_05745 [Flavivirga aquimarina]|uniref:Uncharacterized protein n=1 Tax=Flavivirga aquimarina TaxID=2027862 RepID=A0ABT8W865_9FLAO|nr:hypothetical protein [Flavivirga aquimarina]MDO5969303.1 hypothetical protein [Flavivirga aquimarina]
MKNTSIVDVLIKNIKTDQELLKETEVSIDKAKDDKRTVVDRLKDYRKDLSVLMKYADETHLKQIEKLGFDLSESEHGLNTVASIVLDIIMKTKDNQTTNAELYNAYVKSLKDEKEAVNYTEFNIKCRSLFNTQRLLRKKGKDPKSSREDIISLNGKIIDNSKTK